MNGREPVVEDLRDLIGLRVHHQVPAAFDYNVRLYDHDGNQLVGGAMDMEQVFDLLFTVPAAHAYQCPFQEFTIGVVQDFFSNVFNSGVSAPKYP